MLLTIMSGKGGTGKTTLAVSLAMELSGHNYQTVLADLDVEEPNAGIFFHQKIETKRLNATVSKPEWKPDLCDFCGKCQSVCRFHAIAHLPHKILVFEELCHSCYACSELCHAAAIPMVQKKIGEITTYQIRDKLTFMEGRLDIGQEIASALVRQTRDLALSLPNQYVILDAPPGSACAARESMLKSELVLLVVEPTAFGLHDMRLVVKLCRKTGKNTAIIINRATDHYQDLEEFCASEDLPVLAKIPYSAEIARDYSVGVIRPEKDPVYYEAITSILNWIENAGKAVKA